MAEEKQEQLPVDGIHMVGWLNGAAIAVRVAPFADLVLDTEASKRRLERLAGDFVAVYLAEVLKIKLSEPPRTPGAPEPA